MGPRVRGDIGESLLHIFFRVLPWDERTEDAIQAQLISRAFRCGGSSAFHRVGRNVGPTERTWRFDASPSVGVLSGAAASAGAGVAGPATAALPLGAGLAFGGGRIGRPWASVCGCDSRRARS